MVLPVRRAVRRSRSGRLRPTSRRKLPRWLMRSRIRLLHWTADWHRITTRDGKEIGKQQRELEAEAVAYVVGSLLRRRSPRLIFYLATYKVTPAMLLEAVETIAKTVKTVLEGCQQVEPETEGVMPSVPVVSNEAVMYV